MNGDKYMFCFLALLMGFVSIPQNSCAQASRDSLNQYVAALQKNPNDSGLQAKIILVAQTIKPAPVVPDDAERYMARGKAAIELAKGSNDYKDAIAEFKKATLAAPWLGIVYFNLAVAQELGSEYGEAIRNYKFYLLADPNAADAKEVKTKTYELEFKNEKATVETIKKQKFRDAYNSIKGMVNGRVYRHLVCSYYMPGCETCENGGCNANEADGTYWRAWYTGANYKFNFPDENTIQLVDFSGKVLFEGKPDYDWEPFTGVNIKLYGDGVETGRFTWYTGAQKDGGKQVLTMYFRNGTVFRFGECPLDGGDAGTRYRYNEYRDIKEFPLK